MKTYPQLDGKVNSEILKSVSVRLTVCSKYFQLIFTRERYDSAKKQLDKGQTMFEKVIQQLVELSDWSHLGLICFTEIENREVMKTFMPELTKEELKVFRSPKNAFNLVNFVFQFILTKEEIEDPSNTWLRCLETQQCEEEEYSSLASLLLGSQYVSFRSQDVSSLQDQTYRRLVGGAELHSQLSSSLPDTAVSFQDIKNKALGHISR